MTEARDLHSETRSSSSKTSGLSTTGIGNTKESATTTTTSNTAVKGEIKSGQGGITIDASDSSVAIQGVDLDARGKVAVKGGGGVSITGAIDTTTTTTETRSKGQAFLFGLHDGAEGWNAKKNGSSTTTQSKLVRTEVNGSNIELSAKSKDGTLGTVVLGGTTLNTPGSFSVEADKLLLATQQSETSTSSSEQKRDLVWQKGREMPTRSSWALRLGPMRPQTITWRMCTSACHGMRLEPPVSMLLLLI